MKQRTSSDFTGAVKEGQVQREKYEKHQRCVYAWVITYYKRSSPRSRVGIFISGTIELQNLLYMDKTNGSDYSVACHWPLSLSLSLSLSVLLLL